MFILYTTFTTYFLGTGLLFNIYLLTDNLLLYRQIQEIRYCKWKGMRFSTVFDLRLFAIIAIANVDIGEQYYSSVRTVSTAHVAWLLDDWTQH